MNYSYFVGLDVSKKTLDASLMTLEEKELGHKVFANTPEGIRELLLWIGSYGLSLDGLLFCAENMGSYVTDLSLCSVELSFNLALACPLSIKKSMGLQRGKNDRIDAKRIANYAVLHYRKLKLYQLPDKDLAKLRTWIIIRDNLVKQKVSIIKLQETLHHRAKLADGSSSEAFLKEHLMVVKAKIKEVESDMLEIISSNLSLFLLTISY
ncbi:MAG: IS110 family transposase [Tannerellaceae bacterium]|nr:IS110 family transposase [Tannerellaceae bacterium]